MRSAKNFLDQCDTLVAGQSLQDILFRARQLLTDIESWCQYSMATTVDGLAVRSEDPLAAKWSIEGAVAKVSNEWGICPPSVLQFLDSVVFDYVGIDENVGYFNDNTSHEAMLDFLDEATRRAA